jgi:hypothetical protein
LPTIGAAIGAGNCRDAANRGPDPFDGARNPNSNSGKNPAINAGCHPEDGKLRGRDPVLPRVVVHIGAPKVASTSIQSFLRRNVTRLREQGIFPLDKFLMSAKPDGTSQMGPHIRSEDILAGGGSAAEKTSALIGLYCPALEAEARASGCDMVVFSAENLARLNAERDIVIGAFQEVGRRFDLRVVFHVRRPDFWLESCWKQWALKVSKASPARWATECAERGMPDFLGEARAWSAALGRQRLFVRPLDPATLWNEAVLEDFAGLIGAAGLDRHLANENRMLNAALLRFFHRHADLLFHGPHDVRIFKWAEAAGLFAKPGHRLLSAAVRHRILALLSDSNRALLTEFCPNEAPALLTSWCPPEAALAPVGDLDLPEPPRGLAVMERLAAKGLAQALRFQDRISRR